MPSWPPILETRFNNAEQPRLFVEILPRGFIEAVRKAVRGASITREQEKHFAGYESAHGAILGMEQTGALLLDYVAPENILFYVSQDAQTLAHFPIILPSDEPYLDVMEYRQQEGDRKQSGAQEKAQAHMRALILCKLRDPDQLEPFRRCKKQNPACYPECYEITWRELQELKRELTYFSEHV